MFGYIEPDKGELKMKELTRYRAFYCALCKSIGARYSQTARLTLNYDCAFFALALCNTLGPGTLWRAHMSRRKTDLNLFRAVRGTWAAVGSFAALRMLRTLCG